MSSTSGPRVPADGPGSSSRCHPINRDATVFVAGHRGLVGSAIWRQLEAAGFTNLIGRSSSDLDLRDRRAVEEFFKQERPQVVILAAARVGGILANDTRPHEFISDNLLIQVNVLDSAVQGGVGRLLFLGSSCIYPKFAPQPIREEYLLTGKLEPTNDAYAVAKIAGIQQVRAIRKQHSLPYISAMPTNLYGPHDNFDLSNSHVLPALVRKMHEAKVAGSASVSVWGSGNPRREFLYVDDLASACLFLLEHYDSDEIINVGTGEDVSIRELAELTRKVVGYRGDLVFDTSKPDGTPRKLLDVTRLHDLGWRHQTTLYEGLQETYAWYCREIENAAPERPRM